MIACSQPDRRNPENGVAAYTRAAAGAPRSTGAPSSTPGASPTPTTAPRFIDYGDAEHDRQELARLRCDYADLTQRFDKDTRHA
jgi:hypothetical protein